MKGQDTTMKLRFLSIIPIILLTGCVNNNTSVFNVSYSFDYDLKAYRVVEQSGKTHRVTPEDYFEIKVDKHKVVNGIVVENEYYVVSEKLYVYIAQWVIYSITLTLIVKHG